MAIKRYETSSSHEGRQQASPRVARLANTTRKSVALVQDKDRHESTKQPPTFLHASTTELIDRLLTTYLVMFPSEYHQSSERSSSSGQYLREHLVTQRSP
jgi:hypothetical protein